MGFRLVCNNVGIFVSIQDQTQDGVYELLLSSCVLRLVGEHTSDIPVLELEDFDDS
jgi:hypothetical protein